jgi:hypothetical protein
MHTYFLLVKDIYRGLIILDQHVETVFMIFWGVYQHWIVLIWSLHMGWFLKISFRQKRAAAFCVIVEPVLGLNSF